MDMECSAGVHGFPDLVNVNLDRGQDQILLHTAHMKGFYAGATARLTEQEACRVIDALRDAVVELRAWRNEHSHV